MKRKLVRELELEIGKEVKVEGWIHRIRKLKSFSFIILRDRTGLVQCICGNELLKYELKSETVVSLLGKVVESKNDLQPFEIQISEIRVLNYVKDELPIEINKAELEINIDTMLNNRVLSLRHEKINAIFKIQNLIVESFREFLIKNDFTEIYTPKIVAEGAEGGTEVFQLEYFDTKAYLAQSPQFYKQMMVASGYERVFEVGHAYRAEQHKTARHLNEFISLDLEMGFIEDENDIMDLEENLLKYILERLLSKGEKYYKLLNIEPIKVPTTIPKIKLREAIEILKKYYEKDNLESDLDPEGERLLGAYAKEKYDSDFIFITHYPRTKRPMYTMPCGEEETHSFDLLFRGMEITSGGQRIHIYDKLIENIKYKGLDPEKFESYTSTFKFGMPPHGGLAIGLERLISLFLGLNNVREATLFPRDRYRLTP